MSAAPISRPYACPSCGSTFTKWGLCQSHLRQSACRSNISSLPADELQEHCREAAKNLAAAAPAEPVPEEPTAVILPGPPPPPPPLPETLPETLPTEAPMKMGRLDGLDESEAALLTLLQKLRACPRRGGMSMEDLEAVREEMHSLTVPASKLEPTLKAFLLPPSELRVVKDKRQWLRRCAHFSQLARPPNPGALSRALAHHALDFDSIAGCVEAHLQLERGLGDAVATDLGQSPLANIDELEEYYHLVLKNRRAIQHRLENPPEPVAVANPLVWEDARNTQYCVLLHLLLKNERHGEPKVLEHLSDTCQPDQEGSLLHTHLALQQARAEGEPEVSLLHAAAKCGAVLVCERLLAEGLDVNELAGSGKVSALHVSASHGELAAVQLLLTRNADPWLQDANGAIPLQAAIVAARSENTTPTIQFEVCDALLKQMVGPSAEDLENRKTAVLLCVNMAKQHKLAQIYYLLKFYVSWQRFLILFDIQQPMVMLAQLRKLQYETAIYVMSLVEKHIKLGRGTAISLEGLALVESEFVTNRDELQRLLNRVRRKVPLSSRFAGELMAHPLEAGKAALGDLWVEGPPGLRATELEGEETLQILRTPAVQDGVTKGRSDRESWLRVMGLRARSTLNRKDELTLKREIERRLALLLAKNSTPLIKRDFDFRVRKFFHEISGVANVTRVNEILAHIESAAVGRSRDEVRVWPAYVGALVKRYDPKIYQVMVDKDKARDKAPASDGEAASSDTSKEVGQELDGQEIAPARQDNSEETSGVQGAQAAFDFQ